jgi:glycosyltransferase involved in cell wall biosynthesis
LGAIASQEATRLGSSILAYSGGPARASFRPGSAGEVLFQFHPLPEHERAVLISDQLGFEQGTSTVSDLERSLGLPDSQELARWEIENASRIITASSFTRAGILSTLVSPHPDIVTVPYGSPPIGRRVIRGQHQPLELLFIGQGLQRKGIDYLLHAWKQLRPTNSIARLTMVVSFADSRTKSLLHDSGVRVLGRLSRRDLLALMDSSSVLVLPSLVEGFGLVITEALARGLHVVATTNTGLPDLPLVPGAGTVIEPSSVVALSTALDELISNPPNEEASYESAQRWTWADFREGIRAALAQGPPPASPI